MSVDKLRQLNALRTFAHGFDHLLPPGDVTVDGERTDDPAMKVASAASQAGGFLANHPDSDAAASMRAGWPPAKLLCSG
ncbi:hypothetical protein [Citrobacter cronae]|uniref:hypothetical protein n=1 Tax=Citrobacter cronae TaxID=1748967 RepID=UPI003BEEDB95